MAGEAMRILVVATKPPWPPAGGGTLTLQGLLAGLVASGVDVRVVALGPAPVAAGPAPYPVVTTTSTRRRFPGVRDLGGLRSSFSLARYRVMELHAKVAEQLAAFSPHVIHLEQLHLAWLLRHLPPDRPVVLREQNVEHVILSRLADISGPGRRELLRLEARLVARAESRACVRATAVAAISTIDARALRELAPQARVTVLPAAWPGEPAEPAVRLAGEPAFLCVGSFDWIANRDGARWLLREVWPRIRNAAPGAVLHLAGPGAGTLRCGAVGVVHHDCRTAVASLFDPASTTLVPVRAGSGVRMRLLAAWQHGVPAVTTPVGGEGLVAADGDGAALATTPDEMSAVALRVAREPALRVRLVSAGRAQLASHAPARVAAAAVAIYREVMAQGAGRRRE